MREIKSCSEYAVKNFNSGKEQIIKFTEKLPDGTFNDGTTNEEIINMLIERCYALQNKNFSVENRIIITLLKDIRRYFNKRLSRKIEKVKKYNEEIKN
jgi:hypothetical protein